MEDNDGQRYLPGVLCRGPTWFTAWPRMSIDLRVVIPVG